MSIRCPKCGCEYDVTLFQFGHRVKCECGDELSLEEIWAFEDIISNLEDRERAEEIRRAADRISQLILSHDVADVDIEIEKSKLRQLCEKYFPTKLYLYDMIYESRFKRLWEQFRKEK